MSYLRSAFTVAVGSIVVACALFMFTGSAQAQALAQVDWDSGTQPPVGTPPTQPGWNRLWWAESGANTWHPIGSGIELRFAYQGADIGNTVQDNITANLLASPLYYVHVDAVRSNTGLEMELRGLVPNTAYNLRIHHWRDFVSPDYNFDLYKDDDTVTDPNTGEPANLLFNTGNFGDTTNYWTDFVHTSDSNGGMWLETKPDVAGQAPNWSGFEVLSDAESQAFTDFDNSGTWNLDDLNLVLFNWQELEADLPVEWVNQRPAEVGLDQLNNVLFNWQQPSSLAVVPEPAGLALLLLGGLGPAFRRRRP